MSDQQVLAEFERRIRNDWLPVYCEDRGPTYMPSGYRPESNKVTPFDARDCIRAFDSELVTDTGGGRYWAPKSNVKALLFWEHKRSEVPRRLTLWLEPVITIGVLARLHLVYGWPKECLGLESPQWEFDFTAFLSPDADNEYVAGEVKKTVRELDRLIELLQDICKEGGIGTDKPSQARKNAFKKWEGLCRRRAPLFWAVGPGGVSYLFNVNYSAEGLPTLQEAPMSRLKYSSLSESRSAKARQTPQANGTGKQAADRSVSLNSAKRLRASQKRVDQGLRRAISVPIPEIADAARYLDAAVTAHLRGNRSLAKELIRLADMPEIRRWTKSIWADDTIHLRHPNPDPPLPKEQRVKKRNPTASEKVQIHARDGYHCRFCGIPVIRPEIRKRIRAVYSDVLIWGRKEIEQHAAFQAMWAQYDHLLPHARGGTNHLDNLILTCAPCNFGRAAYTLEEVGVEDPWLRPPVESPWDGLERFQ